MTKTCLLVRYGWQREETGKCFLHHRDWHNSSREALVVAIALTEPIQIIDNAFGCAGLVFSVTTKWCCSVQRIEASFPNSIPDCLSSKNLITFETCNYW